MQPAGYSSAPLASGDGFDTLPAAINWLTQLATGTAAVMLCVIAIATIGLMMLGGRLNLRRGARIILGCFVLLGAPAIASGLMSIGEDGATPPPPPVQTAPIEPRLELPPSNYDPYARASLRSD